MMVTKGEQTRRTILRKALGMSARTGLNQLTIGNLADELDMSKSGLFGHFKSKEALQLQVLEHGADEFIDDVVRPAFKEPAGEPRIRALFERWVESTRGNPHSGGCPFVQFSFELDDQPGPLRDRLIEQQRGWIGILSESARRAVDAGHFRSDLDPEQFAHDFQALMLGYHHAARLLHDDRADDRVLRSFETLIQNARRKE